MSRPGRKVELPDPRLSMHLCHRDAEHPEGFWLYDKDAKMNLALGAATEFAALVAAVNYWKKRAKESEAAHEKLKDTVNAFVDNVHTCETECHFC